MEHKQLFKIIDSLNDSYIQVWQEVCEIESPSHFKEGVDRVGTYFAEMAKNHGWKVDTLECEKAGNTVCITMNPDADAAPICISGHIDTVHAVGAFGYPAVKLDDTKIYGPGVDDCKGGVVAGFLAMDALSRFGYASRPVKLLLQTDEEVSSRLSGRKTINYIIDQSRDAIAFLNLEGSVPDKLCLSRKGIVTFLFTVTGKAAHSCYCATDGANAIIDAAYKMIEIDKLKDAEGLTCNCAVVSGGTVVNTVPDRCEFKVNVRFATEEQYDRICEYVEKLAKTVHVKGCSCEVAQVGYRTAMELRRENEKLLAKLNDIFKKTGLPERQSEHRFGGSDAADITRAGIPCIDSYGVEGGKIHTLDEFAYISSLKEAAYRIAAAILYL